MQLNPVPNLRRNAFNDLCQAFDYLLTPGLHRADPTARDQLAAYARIMDLEFEDVSAADLWRELRVRLANQLESGAEATSARPRGFAQPKVFVPATDSVGEHPHLHVDDEAAPLTLLVAEDDPDLSAAVVETLADAGHNVVVVASSAHSAASQAALHQIDLAIVDVELADETSGVDLAAQLRGRWGVPVLFLSGARHEHLVGLDAAVGFLGKPFTGAQLLAAVTLSAKLIGRG